MRKALSKLIIKLVSFAIVKSLTSRGKNKPAGNQRRQQHHVFYSMDFHRVRPPAGCKDAKAIVLRGSMNPHVFSRSLLEVKQGHSTKARGRVESDDHAAFRSPAFCAVARPGELTLLA